MALKLRQLTRVALEEEVLLVVPAIARERGEPIGDRQSFQIDWGKRTRRPLLQQRRTSSLLSCSDHEFDHLRQEICDSKRCEVEIACEKRDCGPISPEIRKFHSVCRKTHLHLVYSLLVAGSCRGVLPFLVTSIMKNFNHKIRTRFIIGNSSKHAQWPQVLFLMVANSNAPAIHERPLL